MLLYEYHYQNLFIKLNLHIVFFTAKLNIEDFILLSIHFIHFFLSIEHSDRIAS